MNILNSYQRARILLLSASCICFLLIWEFGRWFHLPIHRGFEDSLLQQPSWPVDILLLIVVLLICAAIGTVVAGMVRFNAGLVAACLGLCALSMRGGSSRQAIFWALAHNNVPGIFRQMVFETIILGLILSGIYLLCRKLYFSRTIRDREGDPAAEASSDLSSNLFPSLAVQTLVTLLLVLFLTPSEAKNQVIASVFIASLAGSIIAHQLFPTPTSSWYFLPPLIVGALGYALAYFNPDGAAIASLGGTFAPLARPLPLDYASAGPAAAIIGHWMSRRWQRQKQQEAATAS